MPNNLEIEQLNAVSVVDKGANNKRFLFWKRAPKPEPVEKALFSFQERYDADQAMDTLYDAFWLLDDILWDIRYSDGEIDKAAATRQAIAEFAALIGGQVAKRGAEVANGDAAGALRKRLTARVEKAGARHSAADQALLAQMRALVDELDPAGVSTEADTPGEMSTQVDTPGEQEQGPAPAGDESTATNPAGGEPVGEGVEQQEAELTPEQMAEAVQKAVEATLAPLREQFGAIEKQVGEIADGQKRHDEAAAELAGRVEDVAKSAGTSKTLKGQETVEKADSKWPSFTR